MKKWIITNRTYQITDPKYTKHQFGIYEFWCDSSIRLSPGNDNIWLYDGYVLPRQKDSFSIKKPIEELCEDLYKKYGDEFIQHVKGNFVLIRLCQDSFSIYSDRFGIKKFFYWQNVNDFIISNDIKEIISTIDAQPSAENIAIYALTYHFTGGTTLFKNIKHNKPGQIFHFRKNKFSENYYWDPEQLLHLPKKEIKIQDLSNALKCSVSDSLTLTNNNDISLSLTGGADTRNLLAIFLKLGIKPHLYTYGNPKSADCIKASKIANALAFEHVIQDITMTPENFEQYARYIIKNSGGIASIHRAHRLMAVDKEYKFAKYMFLGTLGGEYIKGVNEDNYIVPPIVYDNWNTDYITEAIISKYYSQKRLIKKSINIDSLLTFFNNEPYLKNKSSHRKHNSLNYITAHLHDAQDVNLFNTVMNKVFTPFLDIDYLELLFSSNFTFEVKEKIDNKYLKRINNPVYASNFLKVTYPLLTRFHYSGEHRPDEVLFNKYYAGIAKFIRQKCMGEYPPNFPLGKWMENFVREHLPLCRDYNILNKTFDLTQLEKDFHQSNHSPTESYWLKFTNPIMMRFIIEEFKN